MTQAERSGKRGQKLDPSTLREYDIRGVYGETLTEENAYALGRSFGSTVLDQGGERIVVGYDGRLSSPALEAALVSGLVDCGLVVACVGLGPTPMLYYAAHRLDADAGVMVTGSHNPPSYNGFKLMLAGRTLYGEAIQDLGRRAAAGDWRQGSGRTESGDVTTEYLQMLRETYAADLPVDVVWDCGHGAAGAVVTELVSRLPGRHRVLFGRIDGSFPAHHPDPTVAENLEDLIAEVTGGSYQLGIGFDGDGDRIGIVDGRGRIIWGDQILTLLARDVLREHPGATILADVKSSQVLFDEIAAAGGNPLMCRTGRSLIEARLHEIGAPLAGEMSGHIFFADRFFGHDDAIYVAMRFLDMLARQQTTAAELLDSLPRMHNTPELRIDCADERKFQAVAEIRQRLAASGARVNDLDGVRVTTDDGWWLLRASNTQPALVLRCEADSVEALQRLKDAVRQHLESLGLAPPHGF